MPDETKKTLVDRVGKADPIMSMGQRAYDLISAQWPSLIAFFATGGGVTLLAYLTDWARALGPLGIGLIVFAIGATAYLIVSLSLLWSSKRQLHRASAEATDEWKKRVENINPLATDFNKQRIRIDDLANPITRTIEGKKFVDCELLGPANLALMATRKGSGSFDGVNFTGCDVVVARNEAFVQNTYVMIDSKMLGGKIFNCTIIIHPDFVPAFRKMGANIITLTGDPGFDNQPPQGIAGTRRP